MRGAPSSPGPTRARIRDAIESALTYTRNRQVAPKRNPDDNGGWRYSQLKALTKPVSSPHQFYSCNLKASCYKIFDRDKVTLCISVVTKSSPYLKLIALPNERQCRAMDASAILLAL
jgi:hypothetical protein